MRRTVSGLLAWFVVFGLGVGGWQLLAPSSFYEDFPGLGLPAGERPPRGLHQGRGPRPEPLSVPSREGDEGAPHQGSERP